MLPPPYFPVFLLQPIRIHGFATLNTTLYYREHFVDGRVLWPSGCGGIFLPSGVEASGLPAFSGSPGFYYQ